ncbi:dTDP-4-dehydrorhamnose reductase family protein [Pseudoalteromonas sp. SSDWG2]|uniref:dTDP-4-dehydrorhamnose reductase family protein n=1 Tax=Pseudoalteromonas sp. SSDWG2 TaxID=3139391 RepID=UPI003BAB661A
MAKIMLSGATGLLGRAIFANLGTHHDIIGLGFSRAQPPIIKADLLNEKEVFELFDTHRPDFFIHSAAERNPDKFDDDPEQAIELNCAVTECIAKCCAQYQCKLIFISTDYVFDGRTAPYDEAAIPNPLNLYGESKARTESLLQTLYPSAAIVRIPVLYGQVGHLGESAVTVIAKQLLHGVTEFDDDALRFPTDTKDIALVIDQAINHFGQSMRGIYHVSAKQKMTKLDMAKIMAEIMGIDTNALSGAPFNPNAAPRPKDCQLKDTKLMTQGIEINTDFKDAIADILAPHLSQ